MRKIHIIACKVMQRELEYFREPGITYCFLEQALHDTPDRMPEVVQRAIDDVDHDPSCIVLGYGCCCNGVVGVYSSRAPLVIPRVDDCISLFLGSYQRYRQFFWQEPGTYYMTGGWVTEAKDPLGTYQKYCQKWGEPTARWLIRETFKNYRRLILIDTGVYDIEPYRRRAIDNAEFLGLTYEEIRGSLGLFEKISRGRFDDEFISLKQGEPVTQSMFLAER
ncbi:MAG: DUF1638 domain-containing protein [Deltaproteobacteria bacterium]|nr:DUF1638 domain-containing protein [Deltaproteobacteria bacterium]